MTDNGASKHGLLIMGISPTVTEPEFSPQKKLKRFQLGSTGVKMKIQSMKKRIEEISMSLSKLLENDQSLALLTTLSDNSFDSVLITDTSKAGKIIYVNKAFQTLTGFSSKEAVGKTPRILQGPATDKKVITRLANALQKGGKFEGKAINYKKDKTPFIMHWRVVPVKNKGEVVAWAAIQRAGTTL